MPNLFILFYYSMTQFNTMALINANMIYLANYNNWVIFVDYIKYPITFNILMIRLNLLYKQYNLEPTGLMFNLSTPNIVNILKSSLKGMGGVYLLYSNSTGLFYIGSTVTFFRSPGFNYKGRLLDYFATEPKVNSNVVDIIKTHGIKDFQLIILQTFPVGTPRYTVQMAEQMWMLAYPTLNKSLKVYFNVK